MKKEIKSFFQNYEYDMTPDIDVNILKRHIGFNSYESPIKLKFRKIQCRWVLVVLVGILIILPSVFLLKSIYSPTYITSPNKDINKYLYHNFDKYTNEPFTTNQLLNDLVIELYHGKKDNEQYIIVRTISTNNYEVLINQDNNLVLTIDTSTRNIESFLITDLLIHCELIVTKDTNELIRKQIVIDTSVLANK